MEKSYSSNMNYVIQSEKKDYNFGEKTQRILFKGKTSSIDISNKQTSQKVQIYANHCYFNFRIHLQHLIVT